MTRGRWRHNFAMSRLSTWQVGGPAETVFFPADLDDLQLFYQQDARAAAAFFVGHGSNLLVRDGGMSGVVVRTAPGLATLRRESDGCVYAECGVGCPKLARFAAAAQLDGAAFLSGVPGTVGGALTMNAGCEGAAIWDFVEEVFVLSSAGICRRPATDFVADYRRVCAKDGTVPQFAAARLRFAAAVSATAVRTQIRDMLRRRDATQPIGSANCGSVFCNPPGHYAAKLIEQCGLKGLAVGGAYVSDKHANFIINRGDAAAADIENLILLLQQKVNDATGIKLIPEVRIVGKAAI